MRPRSTVLIVILLLGASTLVHGSETPPASELWRGTATMIAGTSTYSEGEFIYSDYVFDDTGPGGVPDVASALPEQARRQLSRLAGGSAEYPHDWARYGDNAADLVELRVTADATDVHYLFRFNTLLQPDSTVIGLAVDEDANETTGGGAWSNGAGLSSTGWERLYTLWGTGGNVATPAGSAADLASLGGGSSVDLEENLITVRVPRAVADPGLGTWRMRAVVGLWDHGAGTWLAWAPLADEHSPAVRFAGAVLSSTFPNVFNVAFRPIDEPGDFGQDRQGPLLAAGDISPYSADVDFAKIAAGYSDPPAAPPAGNYNRVYRSELPGEGVVDLTLNPCYETVSGDHQPWKYPGCQDFYLSRYQPYKVTVATTYVHGVPSPLLMTSHGYNEYYTPDPQWDAPLESHNAIGAFALGRGQGTMFVRAAERDVLEVIADVKRHYTVDANRVSAVGASHGGLFVWLMTALHPDLFSAGFPIIPGYIKHRQFGTENDVALNAAYLPLGPEGDRLQNVAFKVSDLFENLRNLPVRILTGDEDPASPPGRYELTVTDRLGALGYDYIHYGCSVHTHGPQPNNLIDQIENWLLEQVRPENPRFVVYKGNTGADAWNEPWGNVHDAAYWVRSIRFADAGRPFLVRAESHAIAEDSHTATPVSDVFVDPNVPPSVCHSKGLALDPADPLPVSNELTLDLSNVRAMTIQLDRTGLTAEGAVLRIVADHEATLTLTGLAPGPYWVAVDGAPGGAAGNGDSIVIDVASGSHVYTLHEGP
ncbi:MAG: prolyl oligopeptidase family serine peptidase [Actinomycetota bacterium]